MPPLALLLFLFAAGYSIHEAGHIQNATNNKFTVY